ncbi:MAG TPA: MoaD/ThiS family protein [Candidatus Acidoferrales bacterium]|jgi:molybdopterin synthase sulfur carrier subunit|nr:MoaD/ThiS family protein [Candidatus Acidoferrales bacterium]
MQVRVVAFARVRELLGYGEREVELPASATVEDLWRTIGTPELDVLRESTRIARNGTVTEPTAQLADGDEVALLPPVGGG